MASNTIQELNNKYYELKSLRSINSKTYLTGTNKRGQEQRRLVSSRTPLHYINEASEFKNINLNIEENKIEKNIYQARLLEDKIGYSIEKDGERIDVKLSNFDIPTYEVEVEAPTVSGITPAEKSGEKIIEVRKVKPVINGNTALYENVDTDFDVMIEFRSMRVRVWKILKSDKAPKTFEFEIFEDKNIKELNVVDKIVGSDDKGRQTISEKISGEKQEILTEVSKKKVNTYTITETFQDKVVAVDSKTRVRTESNEVEYPVRIDADVEVSVDDTADDGEDFFEGGSQLYTVNSYNGVADFTFMGFMTIKRQAFTRFDGINIPQSATIDDATLNLYAGYGGQQISIKGYAFDENDPNAPTAPGDIGNKTTGIASNVFTTLINNTVGYAAKGDFDLYDIDVSDIVQELVNSYDYSNEAMLFFYRSKLQLIGFTGVSIYDYTWGTTKAPELVINYTEADVQPYRQKLMIVVYN